jgi:predicted amidohydrolase
MKVGFVQNHPRFGEVNHNIDQVENLLGDNCADLIVLPELFASGYQFASQNEVRELAEPIPDGPTTKALLRMAKRTHGVLIAGLPELDGDDIYNSAVVVNSSGIIGTYRKAHLFDTEMDFFQPGNSPLPVYDIGLAKVGVMICFDWRFPETARTLALQGADIIAHPANLVLPHCPQAMITRCLENRVFTITADRIGKENRVPGESLEFIGQSQIVDPNGEIHYRASEDMEEIRIVEIDIQIARDKNINSRNNLFQGRRDDLYILK